MFGIGSWEFVLIVVLALLLFGPDKLPQFARTLGRFMRDFKRYQDLMESTIRAEVFANDPNLRKDPFKTGKEFRERVAGGGFSKAEEPEAAESEESSEETAGEQPESTDEPSDEVGVTSSPETADSDAAGVTPGAEGEGEQEA